MFRWYSTAAADHGINDDLSFISPYYVGKDDGPEEDREEDQEVLPECIEEGEGHGEAVKQGSHVTGSFAEISELFVLK